jgi:hypothetical protein
MQKGPSRQQKRQSRGLLVFSEPPCLPSAGSRSGSFHTSLGSTPRSLIRVFLGRFDYSKKCEEDNPTPAYSPVSDQWRLTALVEVNWAWRVQAPLPQVSGQYLQENHIIETCKEEGFAVSTQETVLSHYISCIKSWRRFKALRSAIWFFCDSCFSLQYQVDACGLISRNDFW